MSRFFFTIAVAAAAVICFTPEAKATPLAPGGSVTPQTLTSFSGSILESISSPVTVTSFGGKTETVYLEAAVVQGAHGLDFLYQLVVPARQTNLGVNFQQVLGYSSAVDVYQTKSVSLSGPGMNPFTTTPTPVQSVASVTLSGGVLGQTLSGGIGAGQSSNILIVETTATTADLAAFGVQGVTQKYGPAFGFGQFPTFVPLAAPEPTTMALWAGVSVGLLGFGALKRRKTAVAAK
jgi:hypothetical protein